MKQKPVLQNEKHNFANLIELFSWMEKAGIPKDSEAWHMNYSKFMSNKARSMGAPKLGVFELTPRCNLSCKMCYVHLNAQQMNGAKELSLEEILSIIDQAADMGMMELELTGGEAMMHPDFDNIYLHCLEKGLQTIVMTNGLLLTDERIEFFKVHRPASVQITLYGWDDNSYERVTGSRVYQRIAHNIVKAKEIGCKLRVSITPNKFCQADDIQKMIVFAADHDLRLNINGNLYNPNKETERNLNDFDLTEEELLEIRRKLYAFQGESKDRISIPIEDLPEIGMSEEPSIGIRCAAGRALFCITWRGEMKPCLDLPIFSYPLVQGFQAAWTQINDAVKKMPIPSECPDCVYLKKCNSCPALHAQGAAIGHADRRICARTKRMASEGLLQIPTRTDI